jgi:hypothetical protein
MSAAATAAGYLYASGRLRGRGAREQEHAAEEAKPRREAPGEDRPVIKKPVRVATLPPQESEAPERPKRSPRIQYRVRRWRPEQGPNDQGPNE